VLTAAFIALSSAASIRAAADSPLESQIESYVKSLRARGSISGNDRTAWLVRDLTTGTTLASINENSPRQAASMIKPFLALAFFPSSEGGKLSYGDASRRHMELMIQKSDNSLHELGHETNRRPRGHEGTARASLPRASVSNLRLVEYIPANGRAYRNLGSAGRLRGLSQRALEKAAPVLRTETPPSHGAYQAPIDSTPKPASIP
jgi:beta-lactamase class A